jgi:hypothetical protein
MRKSKMARSSAKPTKGTLSKRKPVDPKVRAKKRLEQALCRRLWDDSPANERRIAQLEAGTWPAVYEVEASLEPTESLIMVTVVNSSDASVYV